MATQQTTSNRSGPSSNTRPDAIYDALDCEAFVQLKDALRTAEASALKLDCQVIAITTALGALVERECDGMDVVVSTVRTLADTLCSLSFEAWAPINKAVSELGALTGETVAVDQPTHASLVSA